MLTPNDNLAAAVSTAPADYDTEAALLAKLLKLTGQVTPGNAPTIANGTITLGATAQQMLAAATRKGLEIQNTSSGDLWVNLNGTAAVNGGFKLAAGQSWTSPPGMSVSGAISIYGATTSQAYYYTAF